MLNPIINRIKYWLGLESFCQKYARQHGYRLVQVKNIGVNLYHGDELVGRFPSEVAASSEIYYLNNLQEHNHI